MKPNGLPEHRIRIKVGLIFLVVILFLSGVSIYSYSLKRNINNQKKEAEQYEAALAQTGNLINSVQQAQDITNRYLISPRRKHLKLYDSISADIYRQIDEIKKSPFQKDRQELLENINVLLNAKNSIVKQLTEQFKSESPLKDLDEKIEAYGGVLEETPIVVPSLAPPTTRSDTTIVVKEKRGFWRRFKNLFTNEQAADTTISITTIEKDTLMKHEVDTLMFADLKSSTEEASKTYSTKIQGIERQVQRLILAEQNITLEISQLLSKLYNGTTKMTQHSIKTSEVLTQRIFTFAIAVGALSLILIILIIVLIVNDLDKGQKARLALAKEKQLTENLMESRHKLLLSVSHDIKTPLSSMMGYIDLWSSDEHSDNKRRQLQSAQNSARHILSMLTNLLEFSRLEKNSAQLHNSRFDLIVLFCETIEMFLPFTNGKELSLQFQNRLPNSFFVETDYTALKQILTNLLSNAVKYTSTGSVEVSLRRHDNIIFTVSDSGVGMTEEEVREIFKPFSRMKDTLTTEGSGFGMYVTKGLIQSLGGNIGIRSEKGKGTAVTVELPLQESVREDDFLVDVKSENANIKNILVFEDHISLATMIEAFLKEKGYNPTLCGNVDEAEKQIKRVSDFDIVFTDMEMININGRAVLHNVRAVNADIPVWLMTAYDDYTEERALAEGFNGFIKKPIDMNALLAIISGKSESGNTSAPKEFQHDFPMLASLFDDEETILEILTNFVQNSAESTKSLRQTISTDDFAGAQQLCHKIHPFLAQLNAENLCAVLRKMDSLRGQDATVYPAWKQDLLETVVEIEKFARKIEDKYLK